MNQKKLKSINIENLSFIKRQSFFKKPSFNKKNRQVKNDNNIQKESSQSSIISSFQNLINEDEKVDSKINYKINRNIKKVSSMNLLKNRKYSITLKREFKFERRNAIQKKIGLNIEIPNEIELVGSILKNPNERNIEDLQKIAFFISGCSLINRLLGKEQKRQADIEKLVYEISFRIKHKFVLKDDILFRIGDKPDNFYIIIQGKIEILKPIKIIKKLNGIEYFKILLNYQKNEEYFLLKEVIDLNNQLFEMEKDDLPFIKYYFLKLELEEYFNTSGVIKAEYIISLIYEYYCDAIISNKIEELENNVVINAFNPNNLSKIKKLKENLFKFIPKFFSLKIKSYFKLFDKKNIKEITILKYSPIVILKDKDYFGDTAFDTNNNRNATIKILEDTHLCYLEKENYDLFLRAEKKTKRLSSIHFLLDNFFFKDLSFDIFESNFFNHFIYEEKYQNTFLFKQNSPTKYLYFIKSGEVQLSNQSNIAEIYSLTRYISQLNLENTNREYIKKIKNFNPKSIAPGFINDFDFLKKDLISKNNYFLFNILNNDVIGLESIVFDLPYLYNAKIISKSAFIFKIEKNILFELMKNKNIINNSIFYNMKKEGKRKMKLILERFIHNNSLKIIKADNNLTNAIIYNKLKYNEEIQNNKIHKSLQNYLKNKKQNISNFNNKNIVNNNICLSEEKRIPINIFGRNYSLFSLKKKKSLKILIKLDSLKQEGKIINKTKNSNIRKSLFNININNNILYHNENTFENNKNNNFFFTQPINKKKIQIKNEKSNKKIKINHKIEFKAISPKLDEKNNLLFNLDNNYISLKILNNNMINKNKDRVLNKNVKTRNNSIPYMSKTIVNFDKIKLSLKHSFSSKKYINKKTNIIRLSTKNIAKFFSIKT